MNRRSLLSSAVWSVPVVAVAVAAPLAAASVRSSLWCANGDSEVSGVRFEGDVMAVHIRASARNSIDITVRIQGREVHYNLVPPGTPTNGVKHMKNYTPGAVFYVSLPAEFNKTRDFMQVRTIHSNDCTEE